MDYTQLPRVMIEDIARLRRRMSKSGMPEKRTDKNLIIGTWNIQALGGIFPQIQENSGSPKRNLRALTYIAEIVRCFDVLAVQEVLRETTAVRLLQREYLGPDWGLILSDVSTGDKGNSERLAFLYDRRRVCPSGLAGEIVLPPTSEGDPNEQFDRTPYIVGFQAGDVRFALLTAHIRYGETDLDRLPEIQAMAAHIATEIRAHASSDGTEESNLIVLGDFNIDKRVDNPLFDAFISTGLLVPQQLMDLKTTYGTEPKYYDQIAWFMGDLGLSYNNRAGVIDFVDAVYKGMSTRSMTFRMSDHFPLWAEFVIDRSEEQMAQVLGIDPGMPNPLDSVPD